MTTNHTAVRLRELTAARAKQAREAVGWNIAQTARALGMSRAAYYDKEAGRTAFSAPELLLLERALGVLEGDLYRPEGPVRFIGRRICSDADEGAA